MCCRASSLYQVELRKRSERWADCLFIPILFWYDGTHVARRQAYIDLVFEGEHPLPLGHFIEDTFSQVRIITIIIHLFNKDLF